MKTVNIFLITLIFFLGVKAQAKDVDCKRWMIQVNVDNKSSKVEITNLMGGLAKNVQLQVKSVNQFFSESFVLVVEHLDSEVKDQGLSKSRKYLESITEFEGVEVDCDHQFDPEPRVTGSN